MNEISYERNRRFNGKINQNSRNNVGWSMPLNQCKDEMGSGPERTEDLCSNRYRLMGLGCNLGHKTEILAKRLIWASVLSQGWDYGLKGVFRLLGWSLSLKARIRLRELRFRPRGWNYGIKAAI